MMKISDFKPEYETACLDLFISNEGQYFDSSEKADFERFLREGVKKCPYFVVIEDGQILGCGGYAVVDGTAYLCWGMVKRSWHQSGIGTRLLTYRLREIEAQFGAVPVKIDTSQHTQAFYQKFGFVVVGIKPDGFGPGIDEVAMVYQPGS